ncbi:MAG: hypothetical protein U1E02_15245, partial [Hydrogenophaga sp.]|nr:hypothetical protein [Hydrogenophaga sp.]
MHNHFLNMKKRLTNHFWLHKQSIKLGPAAARHPTRNAHHAPYPTRHHAQAGAVFHLPAQHTEQAQRP